MIGIPGEAVRNHNTEEGDSSSRQALLSALLSDAIESAPAPLPKLRYSQKEALGPYAAHYDFLRRDNWGPHVPERLAGLKRSIASVTVIGKGKSKGFKDVTSLRSSLGESRKNFAEFQNTMQSLLSRMEDEKKTLPPLSGQAGNLFETAFARLVGEPLQSAIEASRAYRDLATETDNVVQGFSPAIQQGHVDERFTIHEARKKADGTYRVIYTMTCQPVRDANDKAKNLMEQARLLFPYQGPASE